MRTPATGASAAATTDAPPAASESVPAAPSIITEPVSQTVTLGRTATFVVVASGAAPLAYQWMRNGALIAGASSPSYTTPAAAAADDGARYSVRINNAAGSALSDLATLTVGDDPPSASESPAPPVPAASASLQRTAPPKSRFLTGTYVGVQSGYIGYGFSNAQLVPGFQAQSVTVPHLATRFTIFGHEFNKYLSGQVTELVPAHEITYQNINGSASGALWQNNVAGFTLKARLPLAARWSLYGEGGLGVVTRNGLTVGQATALEPANYATFLFGGGLDYRIKENWDILTGFTVAPGRTEGNEPTTVFFSGGFDYTLRRLPDEPQGADAENGPIWPRNIVELGYITDAAGYGVNDFFTTGKVAIFWHGTENVGNGWSVDYLHNLFHTSRFFAFDWGADVSTWTSKNGGERFYTASIFPVARIPIVRTNPFEGYFAYSLAGPSFISATSITGQDIGKHFTFQDYMSVGYYIGRKRRITGEVRIGHYSNANLFNQNPGITIPLGFYFGSSF